MKLREYRRTLREILGHPLNANRNWSAMIDYLRWNLGKRLLSADYILPLTDHSSIIISDRQNYGTLTYTCRLWDFREMGFLIHYLRPDDYFVDAGANVGAYSILASAIAGAQSIACEPVPTTYAELCRNVRLNAITGKVDARCVGLGESDSMLRMTTNLGGLNHILNTASPSVGLEIPIQRLDNVLEDRDCAVLKLDVEGYELPVLRGASRTLSNPRLNAIIVELNGSGMRYGHTDDSVHALILKFGFRPWQYDPITRQLRQMETFNRDDLNTLYIRDALRASQLVASAHAVRIRGVDV
jgi:FkbM family methyltransferase